MAKQNIYLVGIIEEVVLKKVLKLSDIYYDWIY